MTYEKAIEIINDSEADMEYSKEEINEAIIMSMVALERQIGRIPIVVDYNYSDLPVTGCPRCKSRKVKMEYKYCPDCGQMLDWDEM